MSYETKNVVPITNFSRQAQTAARASAPVVITGATALVSYQLALNSTLILIVSSAAFLVTISILLYIEMRNQTEKLSKMHNAQIEERKIFAKEIERLDGKLFSKLSEEVPYGAFEIYVKYKIMSLNDFSKLIVCSSKIHTLVYAIVNNLCSEREVKEFFIENWDYLQEERYKPYDALFKQIEAAVSDRIRSRYEDNILISQIHTGESIKIEFKSGWLPSYRTSNGDIIIESPKHLAAVLITGYLISAVINNGLTASNSWLEFEKNRLEIQKLECELKEFGHESNESNKEILIILDNELRELAKNTIRNHEIISAKVTVGKVNKQSKIS